MQILYYISPSLSWKPPSFHWNIARKFHYKVFIMFSSSRILYFLYISCVMLAIVLLIFICSLSVLDHIISSGTDNFYPQFARHADEDKNRKGGQWRILLCRGRDKTKHNTTTDWLLLYTNQQRQYTLTILFSQMTNRSYHNRYNIITTICQSGGERPKKIELNYTSSGKKSRIENKKREHPTILVKRSEQWKHRILNLSLLVAVYLYNVRLVDPWIMFGAIPFPLN